MIPHSHTCLPQAILDVWPAKALKQEFTENVEAKPGKPVKPAVTSAKLPPIIGRVACPEVFFGDRKVTLASAAGWLLNGNVFEKITHGTWGCRVRVGVEEF